MQTLHFLDDARMRSWYIFCRSESLAQLFANFSLHVMKPEYITFIMVWASSRIRVHIVQRKYIMFVVCRIQNRLAVRRFDDDSLQKLNENGNKRISTYRKLIWIDGRRAGADLTVGRKMLFLSLATPTMHFARQASHGSEMSRQASEAFKTPWSFRSTSVERERNHGGVESDNLLSQFSFSRETLCETACHTQK